VCRICTLFGNSSSGRISAPPNVTDFCRAKLRFLGIFRKIWDPPGTPIFRVFALIKNCISPPPPFSPTTVWGPRTILCTLGTPSVHSCTRHGVYCKSHVRYAPTSDLQSTPSRRTHRAPRCNRPSNYLHTTMQYSYREVDYLSQHATLPLIMRVPLQFVMCELGGALTFFLILLFKFINFSSTY
jgi:hypothetical protein